MAGFYTEASYENAVIKIFTDILGYQYIYAPNLERDYRNPFYEDALLSALRKINPKINNEAIQNALYKLHNFDSGSLLDKNIAKRHTCKILRKQQGMFRYCLFD